MSTIFLLLQTVHENVHDFTMKLNFSEPKIFTGGVDITKWSTLTKVEQDIALKKDWYVYYSFRNSKTGKLERQPNIKAGVNKFKTKKDRLEILKTLQRNLLLLLEKGFNPYNNNSELLEELNSKNKIKTTREHIIEKSDNNSNENASLKIVDTQITTIDKGITIKEAFELGLKTKKSVLSKTSFPNFSSNTKRFEKWLYEKGFTTKTIDEVTKKIVIEYLNEVLEKTSPRTRNNTRVDLSSLFQVLEDNEIIVENFIKKINVLKATPERNKTYTSTLQNDIYSFMEENDKTLLLFVKFISYNYLRPIEVCRLRIEDIDLVDRKLYVKAKNSPVKTKIIPEILLNDLPDLSKINKKHFLFTPNGIGGEWETKETDKRDYFSKRFKKVKDHFELGKEYGLYSFRHTFITKLYNEFAKNTTPNEAKSKLMLITGHSSMDALEKYLRDIDAVLPEDYSEFLAG